MSTDDILDAIDHALRDVSVGADAMRWTPDTVPEDAKDPSGRHATDVLVGREERPAVDAWDARERDEAGARYRAACTCPGDAHTEECLQHWTLGPEWRRVGYTSEMPDWLIEAAAHSGMSFAEVRELLRPVTFEPPPIAQCPPSGEHSAQCRHTPCGRAVGEAAEWTVSEPRNLTVDDVARIFDVPADVIRRTFGACACPESGHLATCVMRTLTHRGESALAEHVERARGRQWRPGWRVNREATEHIRTRQERVSGRMEGARETYSVLEEVRRWSNDPRSPMARRGHDFTRGYGRCPGCKAIRDARVNLSGPDAQDIVDSHTRWSREHAWVEDMMRQYRIPLRGDDPLPYYRALWNNAQLHGNRMPPDVPHCRLSAAERGMKPYLLLGGQSPWDGSVMYLAEAMHAINVADTTPEPLSFPLDLSPVSMTIPTDTYTAHKFRYGWRGNSYTEVVYLSGVTEQYMVPIVSEAIHRGLIGPDAWRRADRRIAE